MSPKVLDTKPAPRVARFYNWLCAQTHRNDPMGDFARDVCADGAFPKDARFAKDLRWFAEEWFGGDRVYDAFLTAWREYRRTPDGRTLYRRAVRRHFTRVAREHRQSLPRLPRAGMSPGLRTFVLARDGFRCRRCGNGPEHERLVIDHITPVSMGGTDAAENLQTLCELCNQGKGASAPLEHDLRPLGRS